VQAGVGYGFSWGDLLANYRLLYSQPGRAGVNNVTLYGFEAGATFHF
jgi:hypothetical protein